MKISKGVPTRKKPYVLEGKYKSRSAVIIAARKLRENCVSIYLRKAGKLGKEFPYEIWVLQRNLDINNIYKGK